jgi:hypothetical protein
MAMNVVDLLEEPITEVKKETTDAAEKVDFVDVPPEAEIVDQITPVQEDVIATEAVAEVSLIQDEETAPELETAPVHDEETAPELETAPVHDEAIASELEAEAAPILDEPIPTGAVIEVIAVEDEVVPSEPVTEAAPLDDAVDLLDESALVVV